jgi:CHAT domain-containing protein
VPSSGGHPDPGLLAAHAERRLVGAEAAQLEAHLADCSTCYETFAETVQFLLAEEPAEEPVPNPARVLPFHRRPAFQIAAGLAAAAGLVLAVRYFSLAASPRPSSPLAELAQAMGPTRFIEPRLTGGFLHGRLVVMRSGDTTQGLDAHSPAVIAAVAHIRERAQGDTSPEALGALAVTYLVSGDVGGAVKALESATAQDPKNARLQSDLAAAYLVRATRLDEPSDIPKALEAAEKSIEQKDAPVEAWFNRALAFESLHLVDAARKAWDDYLKRDSSSPWAEEAKKRRDELPPAQQSTLEEDRARAALAEGKAAVEKLAAESPSILRDYFDNVLLYVWADAFLAGKPDAPVLKAQAELVGDALFRTTSDAMPRDAVLALSAPPSGPSRDPPRTQALGYKALQSAQQLFDGSQPSCLSFREAQRILHSGGSPYASWAEQRGVERCLYPMKLDAGLAALDRIEFVAKPRGYSLLLGRVRHMQGLFRLHRGEFSAALDRYRLARESFRSIRDLDAEAKILGLIAEVLRKAGEGREAWRQHLASLSLLDRVRDPARRYSILGETALACQDEGLFRCTLNVETTMVEIAIRWSNAQAIAEAFRLRGSVQHALRKDEAAVADLAEARRWITRVGDRDLARRLETFVSAAEGEAFIDSQPERAAAALERAISYYEASTPALVPRLRLLLARAQLRRGLDADAEAELASGIQLIELQRVSLKEAALQARFFDTALPLFDDMVALQIDKRHDPQQALWYVERGRARQVVDSLRLPQARQSMRNGSSDATALSPLPLSALQQELPEGSALVYYVSHPTRLLSWVVTRRDVHFVEQSLVAEDLRKRVAAYQASMEGRAAVSIVREQAAGLFDLLVRPLASNLRGQEVLVLLPDALLQPVSFAGLWNRESGRFLAEDYLVASAPSGTVFARASEAAARGAFGSTPQLLAVGNPKLDRDRSKSLPTLPGAEAEATEIAALYQGSKLLTGRAATKTAFLAAARTSDVVHFAGHATFGDGFGSAQMLFASDPQIGTSGVLNTTELERELFPRTRVVVLAGCGTASGAISRLEGAMSLARPFLAAGVPSVIASLWDVDDHVSRRFFVAFHRALISERDPALALRATQVAFLRDAEPSLAHPASWAAFSYVGGLGSTARLRPAVTVAQRAPSPN